MLEELSIEKYAIKLVFSTQLYLSRSKVKRFNPKFDVYDLLNGMVFLLETW